MKKILLILTFILFSTLVYAGNNDNITESGFINKKVKLIKDFKINDPKNNLKVPLLAFTHPKDKYEGLLSDWLEEIPSMKRIVISENYKINGKKCIIKGYDWSEPLKRGHSMDKGLCFQYYNPTILEYIASRI